MVNFSNTILVNYYFFIYTLLVTEKLTVKNMTRAPQPKPDPDRPGEFLPNGAGSRAGLNREILDTAPATFLKLVKIKAEDYLEHVV